MKKPWQTARILDKHRKEAAAVLDAMRAGATLFSCGYGEWRINGQVIKHPVVDLVVNDEHVIGGGDGLWPDCPQSWQWSEMK